MGGTQQHCAGELGCQVGVAIEAAPVAELAGADAGAGGAARAWHLLRQAQCEALQHNLLLYGACVCCCSGRSRFHSCRLSFRQDNWLQGRFGWAVALCCLVLGPHICGIMGYIRRCVLARLHWNSICVRLLCHLCLKQLLLLLVLLRRLLEC